LVQAGDLLEKLTPPLVVEPFRRKHLRGGRQAGPGVGPQCLVEETVRQAAFDTQCRHRGIVLSSANWCGHGFLVGGLVGGLGRPGSWKSPTPAAVAVSTD